MVGEILESGVTSLPWGLENMPSFIRMRILHQIKQIYDTERQSVLKQKLSWKKTTAIVCGRLCHRSTGFELYSNAGGEFETGNKTGQDSAVHLHPKKREIYGLRDE